MESGTEFTAHLTTAAAIVYAIEYAKRSGAIPWLTLSTDKLNAAVSLLMAAIATAGINWSYQVDGTLIVTGLTGPALLMSVWELFKQFTWQQLVYDGVVKQQHILKGRPL